MNPNKQPENNVKNVKTYKWVVWGILVCIYFIAFFHRLAVGVITKELKNSFGMNASQIANLGAMYFYSYIIMQIPTGILVDNLGPKKTVTIGTLVAAFGSIIFALSQNIPMAYIGRLLVGLGVSVVFLCTLKIQSNWFPPEKFATMSGLTSFIGSMGGLLAQTPLIALIALIGWRNSFLYMGIITSILAVLVMLFVKNSPEEIGLEEANLKKSNISNVNNKIIPQLREVIKNPKVWFPAFVFGGINGGFLVFTGTFGVSYISSVYGLTDTSAANLIVLVLIITGISNLLIGGISDRLNTRKLPLIVLTAISVASWSILVFLRPSVYIMYILVILIGVTSCVGVICWTLGKEVSNPKLPGMAMSIVNVVGFTLSAILMVVCGKIIDMNTANGLSPDMVYQKAFIAVVISSAIAFIAAMLSTETK